MINPIAKKIADGQPIKNKREIEGGNALLAYIHSTEKRCVLQTGLGKLE